MYRSLLVLPVLFISLALAGEDKEYVPTINAIKVNGETIPAEEIQKIYDYWLRVYKGPGKPVPKELRDHLAHNTSKMQAVARAAVRQYLEKNKLTLDAETVKSDLEAYKAELAAEKKNYAESLKLKGMTEEEYIAKEFAGRAGLTHAKAAEVEKDMDNVKKDFEKKKETLPMRRAGQIRFTYENSKYTRHQERSKENAQKLAVFTLERLKKGADFATVAKEQSDDEVSKEKGGDLGWIAPNFTPKAVADAVYALAKAGEFADIIESDQGFHIVQLTEMKSEEAEFKKFVKERTYALTLSAETKLAKEAKVEDVK